MIQKNRFFITMVLFFTCMLGSQLSRSAAPTSSSVILNLQNAPNVTSMGLVVQFASQLFTVIDLSKQNVSGTGQTALSLIQGAFMNNNGIAMTYQWEGGSLLLSFNISGRMYSVQLPLPLYSCTNKGFENPGVTTNPIAASDTVTDISVMFKVSGGQTQIVDAGLNNPGYTFTLNILPQATSTITPSQAGQGQGSPFNLTAVVPMEQGRLRQNKPDKEYPSLLFTIPGAIPVGSTTPAVVSVQIPSSIVTGINKNLDAGYLSRLEYTIDFSVTGVVTVNWALKVPRHPSKTQTTSSSANFTGVSSPNPSGVTIALNVPYRLPKGLEQFGLAWGPYGKVGSLYGSNKNEWYMPLANALSQGYLLFTAGVPVQPVAVVQCTQQAAFTDFGLRLVWSDWYSSAGQMLPNYAVSPLSQTYMPTNNSVVALNVLNGPNNIGLQNPVCVEWMVIPVNNQGSNNKEYNPEWMNVACVITDMVQDKPLFAGLQGGSAGAPLFQATVNSQVVNGQYQITSFNTTPANNTQLVRLNIGAPVHVDFFYGYPNSSFTSWRINVAPDMLRPIRVIVMPFGGDLSNIAPQYRALVGL